MISRVLFPIPQDLNTLTLIINVDINIYIYISKSIHCLRIYPAREICRVRENRVDRIACRKIGMNGTKNVAGHAWRIVGVLGTVETQREREGRGNERNESSTTHNPGRVSSLKKQIDKRARLIKGDNRRSWLHSWYVTFSWEEYVKIW